MNKYIRQINTIKNNNLETLEKLLHDNFMFIRESAEFIEHIKMLWTESAWLQFVDFKCYCEDENTLVSQDLFHDPKANKRFFITNFDAFKEDNLWPTKIDPCKVKSTFEKSSLGYPIYSTPSLLP